LVHRFFILMLYLLRFTIINQRVRKNEGLINIESFAQPKKDR